MKNLTGTLLSEMSLEEIEALYKSMQTPTPEQKEIAWKKMDTGIYDKKGNLIGDECLEEDLYED